MLVQHKVTPPPPPTSSMSPVPIQFTPGWKETKWSKVPCLRKQYVRQALNPRQMFSPPHPIQQDKQVRESWYGNEGHWHSVSSKEAPVKKYKRHQLITWNEWQWWFLLVFSQTHEYIGKVYTTAVDCNSDLVKFSKKKKVDTTKII